MVTVRCPTPDRARQGRHRRRRDYIVSCERSIQAAFSSSSVVPMRMSWLTGSLVADAQDALLHAHGDGVHGDGDDA